MCLFMLYRSNKAVKNVKYNVADKKQLQSRKNI